MSHLTCPRCGSQLAPPDIQPDPSCFRCTWPNPSYERVFTTIARKRFDGTVSKSALDLENFIAGLNDQNLQTLTNPQGKKVTAKVFDVQIHDDQLNVTFEFDPKAWA